MSKRALSILLALFAACGAETEAPVPEGDPGEEDLLVAEDGKFDTGYYSSLAMELEGTFAAVLELDVSKVPEGERMAELERYRADRWALSEVVDDQLKLAKNQLNAEKLHLNLSSSDVQVDELALEGDRIRIRYRVTAETVVSHEELRESGVDPQSLVAQKFEVKVAADPRNLFERFGDKCAEGFDAGGLADYNYFYYFKPTKAGCEVPLAPASAFEVHALLPTEETYPEYDRLVADKRIDVVVFFGAADHEETVSEWDWGMREWRDFNRSLERLGFRKASGLELGQRWTRKKAGLDEVIDVVSPRDLHALNDDSNGLFAKALKSHEIVIYDGHSFYGSLGVLEDRANYPADTYQIIFMNSCWSYEYYTKQVFRNKATDADATGWALADVVNDTESGWFHNMEEMTSIVLANVLRGAETGGAERTRRYSWQAIIGAMNDKALASQRANGSKTHEIYGASGVRGNRFKPAVR